MTFTFRWLAEPRRRWRLKHRRNADYGYGFVSFGPLYVEWYWEV